MKILLTIALAALMSLPVAAQTSQLESLPGYIDFGNLDEIYGEPRVMVNIGGSLLRLMSAAAASDEPEAAALMRDLKGVRIKVYPTGGNLGPALEQMNQARAVLQAEQWEPVVQVIEENEQVQIFMKANEDIMEGLTVMVVNEEEAVFLNILGQIDPKQIDKVMNQLNVDIDVDTE